ncbi:MAG: tetratricopeptide repeat protein [Deltaproteobacteria bacterium]|nr:tetratricopeptide repeat protein [Deltaproteobacteria bacterium]
MLENEELENLDRIHILSKVADVRERRLDDSKGALEAMGRALELGTDDTVLFSEFKRIAFENEYFTDYCTTIERLADETEDEHIKGEFLLSAASTWDSKLLDEQRAKDGYLSLLEFAKDEPEIAIPAIDALDRILTGEEFYGKLIEILSLKVKLVDDPMEQKDILFRMADIEETILEKSDNALALLKEILEIDETEMRALMALERIYSINEKWIELISVLQSRISYENDNDVRLELMLRVAELFEKELDDTDKAIDAYTQINEEIAVNITALKALEELYKKGSRWSDLFNAYEIWLQAVEDSDEISELNFKMGEILRKHLNEPEQSVEFYKNALENNPDNDNAKESLEKLLDTVAKVMAVEVLAPIARSEGDHEKQLKFLLIMATDADDHMDKSNYYKEAGELAEMGLDKIDDAFDYYIEAVRFGASSDYLSDLMKNVQRLLDNDEKRKKLVSVYSEIASDILDAEIQVSVLQEVAEISFRDLGDIDTAKDFYLKIMDADAENSKAMNALEEIYQEQKDYLELFEIYRQKVHSIFDDNLKIDVLFKQAAVCENHLDDLSTAVSTFESILEIDTVNKSAIESLERLYPKEDRWADLMELLNRQRDNDPAKRVELSHRMGEVAKEKLGDEDQALMYFKDALDEDIEYKPTIDLLESYMSDEGLRGKAAEILEPVYSNQGNWENLARVLDARIEVCDDSIEKKELLARIGTVYEEQLGDLDKAFETFSRLFKEDHEDESSKELLLRLCNILENWKELSEVLAEILENVVGDTQETSELSFMLGDLYENRLQLPEKAIEYYRRVLSFAPDDPKAFDAVERMLLATKTWTELIALYRDATDAAVDLDKQKEFLFKMADIQEEHLEDIDAAINIYKEVIDLDDRDERSSNALDRIYFQNERFDDLADHFRNQIDMAEGVISRNALRRELAKLYEDQIHDFSSAVDLYEEAMAEPEGDKGSVSQLERLILNEDLRERIADILEPVYRETDEWKKLVVILNTQVSYLNNAGDKVEKLKEVAILHESRGQNILLAFNALAEAFIADPGDRFNYDEMIRLAKAIGNWEDVAAAIEPNIEEIFDIEFKKELLQVLGRIFDEQLDNPRKAIDAFTKVLDIDETDSLSLNALEGLYNLVGEWDGLIKILGRKAEFESDPVEQSNLFRAKGAIEEELAARPEDALKSYEAAFEADPQSVQAMISLERIYEQNKKWTELVDVTRQHFDIADNLEQKKHLGVIIAKIYEEKLSDNFEAISAWKLILEEAPEDLEAISALEKLYIKENNFVDLLENLTLQKELIQDQAAFVEFSLRIGDLKKVELSDLDGAIMSYSDVLAQHPTNRDALERLEEIAKDESVRLAAIEVLEPLHKEAERFEKLIELYELKLEIENDQSQRVEILLEIAGITQNGLSEPSKAFDVYVRALKEDPSRSEILDDLQSIADAEGIYKRLCEVFESVAGDMYDQDAQNALFKRLGGIKEGRLGDVKGAIEAYRNVFDNGDTSIDILSALDRLYEREEMWTELDEILEQEMQESSDTGVITQLKLRQAAIKEREFEDYSGAINVYRDILDVSYENVEAVKALEALLTKEDLVIDIADILKPVYEATGGEHKITKLIESRLKIASDDTDRFEQYLLLASHQEQVLGDNAGAFDSFAKAFRIQPDNPEVLSELERLAETSGSWSALVDIAEDSVAKSKIDPELKVDLGLKIAGWAFNQVGDPRKAESLYRTVLEQDGEHLEALSALSNLLTGLGRFEDLLVIMQKQADAAYDFVDKKHILIHAADIAVHELNNVDKAINFYKQVLENDDSDLETLDALIDLTEQKENFSELVELIISRAQFTPDMNDAARFRHRAAALFMGPLENKDKAIDVYREILDSNPLDNDAVNMLITVFENLERWTDLQEIYQHKLDNTSDDSQRIELMRSMAGLSEKRFEEYDDAVDKLQEIVLISPEDENAIKSLERVFTKQERWQDIIDLFEDQANRASDSGNGEKELSLLVKIGELYVDRLDDISGATDIYERVLERDSEHTGALNALAKLYEVQGDFEKVAEVLNRAVETAKPGVEQAEVHYRLARLSVSHLEDEAGAVEHLNKAVSSHSSHGDANKMLAEIARKLEDWTTLYGCLYRLVDIEEEPKDKLELLLDSASVLSEHLSDASGAVEALQKAYELDNSNKDVLLRYSDALIDAGRQDDAIPVIKDLIDAETNGGKKRSKIAAIYHQKLAKAYESKGDQDQALENLEAAYKMDISNTEVLLSLGKLHYAREEYDKAAKLFRALLLQKFDSVMGLTKADVYFYVGDIQLKQGEPKKAKGMFRRGLDEDKDHEGCKSGLAQC